MILRPSRLRLLVLLVVGNLIALILLGIGLYQAATAPPVVIQPLPAPTVPTSTPGPLPAPGPSPTPLGSGGAIAFTLRRNGNTDIYVLNQADRQLVRLTTDPADDRDPAWSPDGNYIAFASNRARNWDIYLLDLASGIPIRLTHDPGFDGNPAWSPDGKYVAFESYRDGNLDIYVMSTAGGQVRRLTYDPAPDYEPAWSPDSRAIAFTSLRGGNKDIYLRRLDDRQESNLTNSPDVDESDAAWSPDGVHIVYVSGPRGNPSIQVAAFDWDTLTLGQTELFGAGASPAWAPDGQSLIYAYERGGHGHLVAASIAGWALFQEVYSMDVLPDDLAWTGLALSPRVIARVQDEPPGTSLYVELVQPTPVTGPPYRLVPLPYVSIPKEESAEVTGTVEALPREVLLSDRVNESFTALRQRVVTEAGWDYLATLGSAWLPMDYVPPTGHSRMNWHLCGRAIALDQQPSESDPPQIALVREDVGNVTYWRVYLRAARQDGSMGEPLREAVWDLNARDDGGRAAVEGGAMGEPPSGYYVDFTALAADYGWERLPSLWRWRYFWPDIRWWEYQRPDGLTWWECMLEVFEPEEIEAVFGPVPASEE